MPLENIAGVPYPCQQGWDKRIFGQIFILRVDCPCPVQIRGDRKAERPEKRLTVCEVGRVDLSES